jgi:hypothetical protein
MPKMAVIGSSEMPCARSGSTLSGVSLEPGPCASAAAFNVLVVLVLLVPRGRQLLAQV